MPIITIWTNVENTSIPDDFESKITVAAAESIGVEKNLIVVLVEGGKRMTDGGNRTPFALGNLKLISYDIGQNTSPNSLQLKAIQPLSTTDRDRVYVALSHVLQQTIGINNNQFLLDFVPQFADQVAIRGSTIATHLGQPAPGAMLSQ